MKALAISLAAPILAIGALFVIAYEPTTLWLALALGFGAIGASRIVAWLRGARGDHATKIANVGLALAAVSVAPLLLFAALWAALLVLLGATWLLNAIGVF